MPSILIAEDDEIIRKSIENTLSKKGYDVVSAKNGTEALHCLSLLNYDVVVTDLMMEQVSGLDLVKSIRSDSAKDHIGIIVVSGLEDERAKLECLNHGADAFLHKPIMGFDLAVRIESMLAHKRRN